MIYDLIMKEMSSRYLYLYETYGPFYICSYAMHHFNLVNRRIDTITKRSSAVFWIAGEVPDLRLHNLMIAPSGYMKTTYMKIMIDLLAAAGTPMILKANMSEAGFIGSIKEVNGNPVKTVGLAEKHADDMVLINEFSAITNAMKANYNVNLSTQLLEALDHGTVSKDLGPGGFTYNTRLTLWAGVQPSHYELSSGLGRRICPLIFLPTRADDIALAKLKKQRSNIRKDYDKSDEMSNSVKEWISSLDTIEEIEFADDVYEMHEDMELFQFECDYFDRLILGYHLAKYGASKKILVTCQDPELKRIIEIQRDWRRIIYEGIDSVMILKIIKSIVQKTTDDQWVTSRKAIAKECEMVSWNKKDVYKKIKELVDEGYLLQVGEVVRWLGPMA